MNRTSRSIRLLSAGAALTVTFALLHSVASLAQPTAIEQLAQAKKASVTLASARDAAPGPR
jgi:hypothetical protein